MAALDLSSGGTPVDGALPDLSGQGKPISDAPALADVQDWLTTTFPGTTLTSGHRSAADNARVHGAPDSMHMADEAEDFVPPQGVNADQIRAAAAAAGMPVTEWLHETANSPHSTGDHIHWGWGPKNQPAAAPGALDAFIPQAQAAPAGALPDLSGAGDPVAAPDLSGAGIPLTPAAPATVQATQQPGALDSLLKLVGLWQPAPAPVVDNNTPPAKVQPPNPPPVPEPVGTGPAPKYAPVKVPTLQDRASSVWAAAKEEFGDQPLGFNDDDIKRYAKAGIDPTTKFATPFGAFSLQDFARGTDLAMRLPGAAMAGIAQTVSEVAQKAGMNKGDADSLARDTFQLLTVIPADEALNVEHSARRRVNENVAYARGGQTGASQAATAVAPRVEPTVETPAPAAAQATQAAPEPAPAVTPAPSPAATATAPVSGEKSAPDVSRETPPPEDYEPIRDPVTWAQTGWRDPNTGVALPLDAPGTPGNVPKTPSDSSAEEITPSAAQASDAAPQSSVNRSEAATKEITPDVAAAALKSNIDPATGARPVGNAALRDFRARMQAVVDQPSDQGAKSIVPAEPRTLSSFLPSNEAAKSDTAPEIPPKGTETQASAPVEKTITPTETGAFDAQKHVPALIQRIQTTKLPLTHTAIADDLGITPAQAAEVVGATAARPNTGAKISSSGQLRRNPVMTGPLDAATLIAKNGGIRNDEGHDLVAGRGLQQMVPGAGPLIRPTGRSIDAAGELLWENGFFGPPDHAPRPTEDQVLQLLEGTAGRKKVFAPEDTAAVQAGQTGARAADQNAAMLADIHAHGQALGHDFSPEEQDAILGLMSENPKLDAENATAEYVEREAMRTADAGAEETDDDRYGEIPFHGSEEDGEPARADGRSSEAVSGDEEPSFANRRPSAQGGSARAPQEDELAAEPGADGLPQTIIPGAEQSARQLAAARENSGKGMVRAKTPQKEAPKGGLFDEGRDDQGEMFAKREPDTFDWSNPGGGTRTEKVGDTEITYGIGKNKTAELTLVRTPKAKRGEGSARAAVEKFTREADQHGYTVHLTADPMEAGVSKPRLERFYKSLDFKSNSGRTRDFSTRAGMIREPKEDARFALRYGGEPEPPFYSALTRGVEGLKMSRAAADQWASTIKNLPGVKEEERAWSGVEDWLAEQKGPVTKDAVLQHLRENEVQVQEVERGKPREGKIDPVARERVAQALYGKNFDSLRHFEQNLVDNEIAPARGTKYGSYTLPGGENYRELLLTTAADRSKLDTLEAAQDQARTEMKSARAAVREHPDFQKADTPSLRAAMTKANEAEDRYKAADQAREMAKSSYQPFKSSHFDEPNILAHVRFDDRTGPNGEKILHMAEVQSDWHQMGRKHGYAASAHETAAAKEKLQQAEREKESASAAYYRAEEAAVRKFTGGKFESYFDFNRSAALTSEEKRTIRRGVESDPDVVAAKARDDAAHNAVNAAIDAQSRLAGGVPNAPFKTSWHELALKRMLRYAAEHGYDKLSWDTGDTSADRYDLSKTFNAVRAERQADGRILLAGQHVGGGWQRLAEDVPREKMADYVGKDLADKINADFGDFLTKEDRQRRHALLIKDKPSSAENDELRELNRRDKEDDRPRTFSGVDLKVGGEGMRGFYDKILPAAANKLGKKFGAKVEEGSIETGRGGWELVSPDGLKSKYVQTFGEMNALKKDGWSVTDRPDLQGATKVHSIPITPAMRESVMQGQPMFKPKGQKGWDVAENETPGGNPPRSKKAAKIETPFSPEFDAKRAEIEPALRKALNKLGLTDIALKLPDSIRGVAENGDKITADGMARAREIHVALDAALDKDAILHHEAIHALKRLDLFKDGEWAALSKKAEDGWIKKYNIEKAYADIPREKQIEEAIAHAYPDWRAGKLGNVGNAAQRAFQKVKSFFEATANVFRGHGFNSADSVMRRIDEGEIGRRGTESRLPVRTDPSFAKRAEDDQTKLPAFKRWFGKSKVVDEDGAPLRVFHGTPAGKAIGKFKMPAYFTESPSFADMFAQERGEKRGALYPAYLKMENPYVIDGEKEGRHFEWDAEDVARMKDEGYDGVIVKGGEDSSDIYTPFDQSQIKSASGNRGTFDENNPDIRFAKRRAPGEEEPEKPLSSLKRKILMSDYTDKLFGETAGNFGKYVSDKAAKFFPDSVKEAKDAIQMAVTPMATGSPEARAAAKDFANAMREARVVTGRQTEYLGKNFKPDELARMWDAADEQSVAMQKGEPTDEIGLAKLPDDQRAAVEAYQTESNSVLKQAQDVGLFKGEGLPSYVPRMVVALGADGKYGRLQDGGGEGRFGLDAIGKNLKTSAPSLRQRKYLTTAETEKAASAINPDAVVVHDFRTLPMAMGRLKQAIAGRTLINKIKEMGDDSGEMTVSEGAQPNNTDHGDWFTIDHPAFKTYRPQLVKNEETGKWETLKDENGNDLMERVPLYVRSDFEGPLRAVLSKDSGRVYQALMKAKGKTMSVVMYSPLMHNAVIWGKAFPAAPFKLLKPLWRDDQGTWHTSIELYGRGRALKNNPAEMRAAIQNGLDPIGHRYYNQDISSIMEEPDLKPGRSWTSQLIGSVPGLFSKEAGDATKRAIDKAGDVWHNDLLWNLVGDLQMGLYQHMRDKAVRGGVDEQTAGRLAAHFANRYAGAIPLENMSKMARQAANMMMFSRSFTLTNLGAYKDMVAGLPRDIQAQILRDSGIKALNQVQGVARKKALSLVLMDITLSHFGLFLAQHALAWATGATYHPPSENEPGRENRFLIGYQADGTAVYGRLPTGKVGEELQDWVTSPIDITKRKLSPYAQTLYGMASNDRGFGRKIYDPYDTSVMGYAKNAARVLKYGLETAAPTDPFKDVWNVARGKGDQQTNIEKLLLPMMGVTVSKGAPGGPAVGALFHSKDEHDFQIQEAMPDIRDKITSGDVKGAMGDMQKLGLPQWRQKFIVRTTLNPRARLNKTQLKEFMRNASPEDKADMQKFMDQQGAMPEQHSELTTPALPDVIGDSQKLQRAADAGLSWSREDAIKAAKGADMPATAQLLREAHWPPRQPVLDSLGRKAA